MVLRLIIQTAVWIAVMGVVLLVPADTLDWPAAWTYLAEIGVLGLGVGLWLARHDPGLLAERLGALFQREQKAWDKIFMGILLLLYCAWLVLMGLDARWAISRVPLWLQAIGAFCVVLSIYVGYLTLRENSFAAPVVKLQRERGQIVVTTGPYRWVRHPMYAGALLFFLGTPLQLGSWLGLAAAPLLIAALAVRVVMEERMLTAELKGYSDYAERVRWRLIPLIW
jgi:protein-S-isoprenylcysteine O-methyltransferase Ste14